MIVGHLQMGSVRRVDFTEVGFIERTRERRIDLSHLVQYNMMISVRHNDIGAALLF